jgi:hypothetical protein
VRADSPLEHPGCRHRAAQATDLDQLQRDMRGDHAEILAGAGFVKRVEA